MKTNQTYLHDEPEFNNNSNAVEEGISKTKSKSNLYGSDQNNGLNPSESEQQLTNLISMHKKEKWYHTLFQVLGPFFVAGFGMVGAGILLDYVQDWNLFVKVKEVIVLVPALLGLKGNLEMTLASRLSTQVNLQLIHDKKTTTRAILGNFAITQLQSIVVGFLASFVACVTEFVLEKKFTPANLLILIGSSVSTASFASLILGGIIMFIIIISAKFRINPDNVATPIASSLGDLVTLAILSSFGTFLFVFREKFWIHVIFITFFVLLIPFLTYYCYKNEFVKETLYHGWIPVIIAMFISSIAGIILEFAIKIYNAVAIYQPVVNGVGGNLVGIFASRLSTSLHKTGHIGKWAHWAPKKFISYPYQTFFYENNPEHKTGLVLMSLALPGHLIFFLTLFFIKASQTESKLTFWMVLFYLIFTFAQVVILLVLCYYLVHIAWRFKLNPDNTCIPLLTAIGDFLGVTFLFLCFHLVYLTGKTTVKTPTTVSLFTTEPSYNLTSLAW